jgi:hypothetical protein
VWFVIVCVGGWVGGVCDGVCGCVWVWFVIVYVCVIFISVVGFVAPLCVCGLGGGD